MIKKTLYFGNPAYLSLQNNQLVIKLPEVERNASLPENFKSQSSLLLSVPGSKQQIRKASHSIHYPFPVGFIVQVYSAKGRQSVMKSQIIKSSYDQRGYGNDVCIITRKQFSDSFVQRQRMQFPQLCCPAACFVVSGYLPTEKLLHQLIVPQRSKQTA